MSLTLAGAALAAGALSAAAGVGSSISNAFTSSRWARKNLDFQKEQFRYQQYMNQLQMQREDSAYQRAVNDAQAAGLSPLAVSGGAVTGDLSSSAFSGVGNNAGQIDSSGITQGINNALGVFQAGLSREQQNNNNALTSSDVAYKFAQTQASNAQTAFLNKQSESISLDNAYKTATMQSRIDEQSAKVAQYGYLADEIQSRTDLNKEQKSKLTAEVKLLETQAETYGQYLSEQLESARLANQNQVIKNDIARLDRLFRNADWALYGVDKQMEYLSKNRGLFGKLGLGDVMASLNGARALNFRADTSWFSEYGK